MILTSNLQRWIIPLIVLPGTALVFVPLLIVHVTRGADFTFASAGENPARLWLAILLGASGAILSLWSMGTFLHWGDGTAAPWDPPRRFVVAGPYAHVRNPMLIGVIAMQLAEALLLQSWPLGIWAAVFFAANAIYFPLVEEPRLLVRFGNDYRVYSQHVRRWIPRWSPWKQVPLQGGRRAKGE